MSDTIIYGKNPVIEAIKTGQKIEKVFLLASLRGEVEVQVRNECKDHNIPLTKVPQRRLNEMAKGNNHQGVLAYISPVEYTTVAELVPQLLAEGKVPLLIVLDGVTDVRNMGAIARSAKVFGAHGLVIPAKGTARVSEEMVKSSAGAILHIPVCRENSLPVALETLQQHSIRVYATDLKATKTVKEVDMKHPTALILGAEDLGVSRKSLQIADEAIKIPQADSFDSLNVSVAAGILFYEVLQQRMT